MEQDTEKAEKVFLQAAQLGYPLAMVRFSTEFPTAVDYIELTEEDGQKLITDLIAAAEAGSSTARFSLAVMYRYGYGVRKDSAKAKALFEELAKQGDVEANNLLSKEF